MEILSLDLKTRKLLIYREYEKLPGDIENTVEIDTNLYLNSLNILYLTKYEDQTLNVDFSN